MFIAGLANVLSRMATGSNAVEQGCTWTKAWLEFTVNRELELSIKQKTNSLTSSPYDKGHKWHATLLAESCFLASFFSMYEGVSVSGISRSWLV